MRLVAPGGVVEADPQARRPGRGAYVCPGEECLHRAAGRGGLARALRRRVALGPDLATPPGTAHPPAPDTHLESEG